MNNKGLNAKTKILIIAAYTIILFSVILISFGDSKINRFSSYQEKPYDDQIALTLRSIENRKSKLSTGTSEKTGEHEKSVFDLQLTIVKLRSNTSVKNIKIYLAAKTISNDYRYDEYTSSSKEMSTLTYTSLTSFTTFATKEFDEITKDGNTEEYLFDQTPVEYYIRVEYQINEEDTTRILEYKTSTLSLNPEKDFKDVEERTIDSNNSNYIDNKEEPIRLKVSKTLTSEESALGSIKEDSLRFEFKVDVPNLNQYKFEEDYLKENRLVSIELPKAENATDPWNVDPEISDIKFEVYGKINGTDENFSNYVKVYSIYGFFSKNRSLSIATYKIDELFNIETLYIVATGGIYNGVEGSFKTIYKIDVEQLPSI